MAPRKLLRRGIEYGGIPHKEIAQSLNIDRTTLSKMLSGSRGIAPDLKPRFSGRSIAAGIAIAHEDTGYRLFIYIEGDRHPQTMIRRAEKEDHDVHEAMQGLAWRTIDKNGPQDLTNEDVIVLNVAAKEIADRIKADINLLIEWDERYRLDLIDYLTGKKEKSPVCVAAEPRVSYNS